MNGITGAAAQNPGTNPIPYTPAEAADLKATGFGFKEGGVDWDRWIETARTSDDPKTQAQLRELIDLAGGRTDNAAIKEAMARYGAMQQAASPHATAADKQAALRGIEDQLTTALDRMDIKGKLTGPLDNATKSLLNDPAYANTEWGKALGNVLGAGKNYASFQWGLAQGIWEGGKSLVTGVVSLAGKALQYGADNGILGQAGDALRGLTGEMPGWLEAFVPSAKRGEASTDALMAMGKGIGDYLSSKTPADVASDIGDAIGKAWDGIKEDHAAARAKGPEAEAEWWGKTIGRVGFEVAATFIPVAGQAGKVSAGVRATDAAVDGARALDKVADGARGAKLLLGDELLAEALKTAGRSKLVAQSVRALSPTAAREFLLSIDDFAVRNTILSAIVRDPVLLDVSTAPGTATFYSGRVLLGNEALSARQWAETLPNRTVLEHTSGGRWLDEIGAYNRVTDRQTADELWTALSRRYAEGASGDVVAVVGDMRPGAILHEELKVLESAKTTGKVTDIRIIDLNDVIRNLEK